MSFDFGALPPEILSAWMYTGPGASPLTQAAIAWGGLATELESAANSIDSVVTELTGRPWMGPSAAATAAAAAPYIAWLRATAAQADQTASQARAAASAFNTAYTSMVPPPVIAANRARLISLVATNVMGQNSAAIAANQADYAQMWARDAAAMYQYASSSAVASQLPEPTPAPQVANPAGTAQQSAAVSHAVGSAAANEPTSLPQLLTNTLNTLSTPGSAADTGGGIITTPGGLIPTASDLGFNPVTIASLLPGYIMLSSTGLFMASAIQGIAMSAAQDALNQADREAAAEAQALAEEQAAAEQAAAEQAAAEGAWEEAASGYMGEAMPLGEMGLSVPPSWAAAATPLEMLGPLDLPMALPALETAGALEMGAMGGMGAPMLMGGFPRAAAVGAAAGAGAIASKYGSRIRVVARPPAAGYPDESVTPAAAHMVPAGHAAHRNAPPGYQAAIVYVPANGQAPAAT